MAAKMTQTEIWKDIPGDFPGYQVSNMGRVRTKTRKVEHSIVKSKTVEGQMLTPYKSSNGRYQVSLWHKGKRKPQNVHKLVMLAFVGECPQGMEIRHLNSVADDNRLCNLAYGTRSENSIDAVKLGRHGRQKLKPTDVTLIRERICSGEDIVCIAKEYGVCTRTIRDIKNKHSFSWL